jgi:hypothetical protein
MKKQLCFFFFFWVIIVDDPVTIGRLLILSTVWFVDSDSPSNFRGMYM